MAQLLSLILSVTLLLESVASFPQPIEAVRPAINRNFRPHNVTDEFRADWIAQNQDEWQLWCNQNDINQFSPTKNDAQKVVNYLSSLGDTECAVQRNPGSTDTAYTVMRADGGAKAGIFFTNNGDTVRGYKVGFKCSDVAYWLQAIIDAPVCNKDGRVQGGVGMPNCWRTTLLYTGDGVPAPDNTPGAGVNLAPWP